MKNKFGSLKNLRIFVKEIKTIMNMEILKRHQLTSITKIEFVQNV